MCVYVTHMRVCVYIHIYRYIFLYVIACNVLFQVSDATSQALWIMEAVHLPLLGTCNVSNLLFLLLLIFGHKVLQVLLHTFVTSSF